jgi:recombination protein RecA
MGDAPKKSYEVIPTGALTLDLALGIGGLPRGRIIELYGPESSGKTTLCYHAIANAQQRYPNHWVVFVDAEHSMDMDYARNLGVDESRLIVSQPDSGEDGLEVAEEFVRSSAVSMVVVDSIAALVPKAEIDGDIGDQFVGIHARLMSKAMRKLAGIANQTGTTLLFTNQLREKIGGFSPVGTPETTPGGRAVKFYASVRLDIRRRETLKKGTEVIGHHAKVTVRKNKCAPPAREAEFDIMYGTGIDRVPCIVDVAKDLGVMLAPAGNYSFEGVKIERGRDKVLEIVRQDTELLARIEQAVIATLSRPVDEIDEPELAEMPEGFGEDDELDELDEIEGLETLAK